MNEYLRDLRDGDLEYLAEHLRECDKEEVLVNSDDVLGALEESVDLSQYVQVIDVSGVPMGIFGTAHYGGDQCTIWMLATDEIENYSQTFLRNSKRMIRYLFEITGANRFYNYTYAKNKLHHRWLRWCGAVFGPETILVGPDEKQFLMFVINRNEYV